MYKLTLLALASCLAVAFAETQTVEILDAATVPLALDPVLKGTDETDTAPVVFDTADAETEDMETDEHKLKAYRAPAMYTAMPIYSVPSYGISTYTMPSYGLPSIPSYGYPSYSSYPSYPSYPSYSSYPSYGYGYPLPMMKALLGHKMKHHF